LLSEFCVVRREAQLDEHPRPTSNKATLDVGSNSKGFFSEPRA